MPLLTKPSFGPRTAIIYITTGSLLDVWTIVWYFAFARDSGGEITRNTQFWLLGLFLTGLTLIVIGFFLGHIGRAARRAELPPPDAQKAEAVIQQTAAATPNAVVGTALPNQVAGLPMPAAAPAQPANALFVPGVTRR